MSHGDLPDTTSLIDGACSSRTKFCKLIELYHHIIGTPYSTAAALRGQRGSAGREPARHRYRYTGLRLIATILLLPPSRTGPEFRRPDRGTNRPNTVSQVRPNTTLMCLVRASCRNQFRVCDHQAYMYIVRLVVVIGATESTDGGHTRRS